MNPPAQNLPPSYERLDERSKSHADKLERLERRAETMEAKLDDIIKTLNEARGGWRAIMIIGGVAATIGAMLAKFPPWTWFSGQ